MTDQVLPRLAPGPARVAARASFGGGRHLRSAARTCWCWRSPCSGSCGRAPFQAALWPLACAAAGISAALLVPVALVLGGASIVALGVASMAISALVWLLLATGPLTWVVGGSLLAGSGLGLAAWLILVCRDGTVPPRAGRVGRRAGVAALAGTAVVAVGQAALPTWSTAWWAVLVLGGVPAALGWLAVPAWSLRLSRWLRVTRGMR